MNPLVLPEYDEVSHALDTTHLKPHASQVHGLISGVLCGNPKGGMAWEELVTGGKDAGKAHDVLELLYTATAQQLKDFLFEFQLLLPNDNYPLPERAEALTLWTQGFLTGLKMANVQLIERGAGEVTEAINDMIEIAKMNHEDVVASEEDENAYTELVEFVRMATVLIYQELSESDVSTKTAGSHHRLH